MINLNNNSEMSKFVVNSRIYLTFDNITSASALKNEFAEYKPGEVNRDKMYTLAGRIVTIRDQGKYIFIIVRSNNNFQDTQWICQVDSDIGVSTKDLKVLSKTIKRGDLIGGTGHFGRTRRGELSLFVKSVTLLAPFVTHENNLCPNLIKHYQISDPNIKYRYRFLNMMTNPNVTNIFYLKHKIVMAIREFLNNLNFIEVETPILHPIAGGAAAKPFVTYSESEPFYLRIAPELYLKQCIVGGMERVYEIGRVFRNEDTDKTHNPEFTSCEFYMAYSSYNTLFSMTEEVLRYISLQSIGSLVFSTKHVKTGVTHKIDLSAPFKRIDVIPELERILSIKFPPLDQLNSEISVAFLTALCQWKHLALPSVLTPAKLLDKLITGLITDHTVQPTFIIHHPVVMSPLAKESEAMPGISERFELFITGVELCNAYTELSDPLEQYKRLEEQAINAGKGDTDTHPIDYTFLKALQCGLPPTAGWGMGIDRLIMILTNSNSIRDVILFPHLKRDSDSHDVKRQHTISNSVGCNHHMLLFCLNNLEAQLKNIIKKQNSNHSFYNFQYVNLFGFKLYYSHAHQYKKMKRDIQSIKGSLAYLKLTKHNQKPNKNTLREKLRSFLNRDRLNKTKH